MRRRPTSPIVLAATLLAVLAAGCGTQVDGEVRQRAADALLAGGGDGSSVRSGGALSVDDLEGDVAGVDLVSGDEVDPAVEGGSADSAGASGPDQAAGGGTATGAGPGAGAPAPAGGNGGATDVGVTGDSVTIGNVSSLSGPIPGLFEGAVNGTNAYVSYVNSTGGVFGRTLKVAVGDDANECGANQSRYRDLTPKVFAFVGSFSVFDECGAKVLTEAPAVPAVQYSLSRTGNALPNLFSPQHATPGYATGPFEYYKRKHGSKVTKVGTVYSRNASAADSHFAIKGAAESVGWKYVYERGHASTEQDFTADIVRMRQEGVEVLFLVATTAQNAARIKRAADSQGFAPEFIIQLGYDQSFFTFMGGPEAAEGVQGTNLFALYFGADEAQRIPEVRLYQEWMKRNNPRANLDVFSVYGWTAGKLFTEALKAAGPQPTRAKVMAELKKVQSYDAGGMLAPSSPAGKRSPTCYVPWEIRGGKYVRVDVGATGYRCDGTYFEYRG